ncbi:DUF2911 domain-containing protein [Croceiramulus getboli]|nr:DUF2911 domain-containing protein [Flavobacteriaceae bacterium YJPT1-3]
MKNISRVLFILLLTFIMDSCKNAEEPKREHDHQAVQEQNAPQKKSLSPHTVTMANVGDAHIHIDYSSPGVRNRIIFGGLLAFGEVWQAGAHRATWIETSEDLIVDGQTLPAGKYGLFTIPTQQAWTVIFNSRWNQHGKDEYDEREDVLRLQFEPVITESVTENLTYTINDLGENKGSLVLAWEKVKLEIPFKVE